jgi:hypothetical protein
MHVPSRRTAAPSTFERFVIPKRLHATCEEYRASVSLDYRHDEQIAGGTLSCDIATYTLDH